MVGPRYQYNLIPACSSRWKPPHKISSTFMPLKLVPGVKVFENTTKKFHRGKLLYLSQQI